MSGIVTTATADHNHPPRSQDSDDSRPPTAATGTVPIADVAAVAAPPVMNQRLMGGADHTRSLGGPCNCPVAAAFSPEAEAAPFTSMIAVATPPVAPVRALVDMGVQPQLVSIRSAGGRSRYYTRKRGGGGGGSAAAGTARG